MRARLCHALKQHHYLRIQRLRNKLQCSLRYDHLEEASEIFTCCERRGPSVWGTEHVMTCRSLSPLAACLALRLHGRVSRHVCWRVHNERACMHAETTYRKGVVGVTVERDCARQSHAPASAAAPVRCGPRAAARLGPCGRGCARPLPSPGRRPMCTGMRAHSRRHHLLSAMSLQMRLCPTLQHTDEPQVGCAAPGARQCPHVRHA